MANLRPNAPVRVQYVSLIPGRGVIFADTSRLLDTLIITLIPFLISLPAKTA